MTVLVREAKKGVELRIPRLRHRVLVVRSEIDQRHIVHLAAQRDFADAGMPAILRAQIGGEFRCLDQPIAVEGEDAERGTSRIERTEVLIFGVEVGDASIQLRSEEHTSELQSLMRISYAVFCLKKKHKKKYY